MEQKRTGLRSVLRTGFVVERGFLIRARGIVLVLRAGDSSRPLLSSHLQPNFNGEPDFL